MWITKFHLLNRIIHATICVYLLIMAVARQAEASCGHYEKINGGSSGYIATDSGGYENNVNCIWWLETDSGYQLSINITYVGDTNYNRCGDFVIVRDGRTDNDIIYDTSSTCTSVTNHVVTATASWMQVQFRSDGVTVTNGFQGFVYSTFVGENITGLISPIVECKSYEWGCSNKVCMTISYRCDGFNDCGCTTNCDEYLCGGIGIDKITIMIIGGMVGTGLFVVFFFFALAYEIHLKRRTLMADPEAQAELQKKKAAEKRKAAYQKAAKEKKGRR